jgi:hypothetical protein
MQAGLNRRRPGPVFGDMLRGIMFPDSTDTRAPLTRQLQLANLS